MLLRVIGWLLMVLTGFMVFPLVTSVIYEDSQTPPILISMGVTFSASFILMSLRPRSRDMGKREAIVLTALTWVILSLFGMLPFVLNGSHPDVTNAFFETMSGFTTTGFSVLGSVESLPHSLLLWRCLLQWIGGLGIIIFTLAVIPMLNNKGGMLMFNEEVTGITHDKIRPRVSNTAKSLWAIYICLTALCILLLWFSKMNLFEAICHGLSTMSTGGFSTTDLHAHEWDSPYIIIILTVFMFIGGINFNLIYVGIYGNIKKLFKNDAFRGFCLITLAGYLVFLFSMWKNGLVNDWQDVVLTPMFQSVAIISSTGLVAPDFELWGPIAFIVMIVFMAVGGCAGSTSGGAKIDRFIIVYRFLKNEMYCTMYPSAVKAVKLNSKGVSYDMIMKVLAFISIYFLVILIGGLLLSALGISLSDSFFYALSAISNSGIVTDNGFEMIPDLAKWILSFIMLTGRLEIYTVLLIFTKAFWIK